MTADTTAAGFAYINAVETSGGADNGMVAHLVESYLCLAQISLIWSHIAADTSDGGLGTIWNTAVFHTISLEEHSFLLGIHLRI